MTTITTTAFVDEASMNANYTIVGRVLRSSTTSFTVGCRQLISEQDQRIPEFGALVRTETPVGDYTYGLIYNVAIEDDTFVRQLVAAGVESAEIIEDQRQKRQVPVVVDVLVVGHGTPLGPCHRLPPQPPRTLDPIVACNPAELRRFTEKHDWLRVVLAAADAPVDQLIVAALRAAARVRPSATEREAYLVGAGRELAKLLALDLARLEGLLRQLR